MSVPMDTETATPGRARQAVPDQALDIVALAITLALSVTVLLGVRGGVRLLLGVAFLVFVPGWAIIGNWPAARAASRFALSTLVSLAVCTAAATTALWLHAWAPVAVYWVVAVASVAAVGFRLRRNARTAPPAPGDGDGRGPDALRHDDGDRADALRHDDGARADALRHDDGDRAEPVATATASNGSSVDGAEASADHLAEPEDHAIPERGGTGSAASHPAPVSRYLRAAMIRMAGYSALPFETNTRLLKLWAGVKTNRSPVQDVWLRVPGGFVLLAPESLTIDLRVFLEIYAAQIFPVRCRDRVVIDVGAHKGYFGAFALARGAAGVVSIEPEAQNFAGLERTSARNARSADWVIRREAVGAEHGPAKLHLSAESWSHSLFEAHDSVGTQDIEMTTLPAILSAARERWPAKRMIIKLNVEGAAKEILGATSPGDLADVEELHLDHEPDSPYRLDEVLTLLRACGFGPARSRNGREYRVRRRPLWSPPSRTPNGASAP